MTEEPEDICPEPDYLPPLTTQPATPPIYTASVYKCDDPAQAARLMSGEEHGYIYSRDGHPNADLLADKCRRLHAADRAVVCGSGMSALAVAVLAGLRPGDHVLVSDRLYGRSLQLLTAEAGRLGIASWVVDTCDLDATAAALLPATKLLVVETITNPLVRVSDIQALADLTHRHEARLLVDNTFASPALCRPLEWGADLVVESLTKIMGGHSDVLLGLLCGREDQWERVPYVLSTWGLSANPFDCWLASRGLGTMALRVQRASENALAVAEFLQGRSEIAALHYPGLADHPDHELARRELSGGFGSVLSFTLRGGSAAADAFIRGAKRIPFCPSLGDLGTTLSHPASTSHRSFPPELREAQGISGGTIRLSVGIESSQAVLSAVEEGLRSVGG